MKKIAVVYQSKYGATRKYAEWIAGELSCDLFEGKDIKAGDLLPYDTIILGGGLYAGGVNGIKLLTKNFSKFSDKNLILFTCGLADPSDTVNTDHIKKSLYKDSLTEEDKEMLASYGKKVDFINKESILPLISYIRNL